jgi:TetR/AcrR family transcriptional repressor of nem operon
MRYPEGHKEEVRARIIAHAARALRRSGLDGVSIPALMKEVGLTHGGFYAHFKDRNALVAEAVEAAAHETGALVLSEEAGDLQATLDAYLSYDHVRAPEFGCVLAALGGEGRRQSVGVRRAFSVAARGFIQLLQKKVEGIRAKTVPTDETLRLAAAMVGAIVLARLLDDERLAKRLLGAVRNR